MPTDRALSELPWSVDVGAVFDGHDVDTAVLVVYAVDHPVVAAPGAVQPVEPELERLAGPVRAGGQRPCTASKLIAESLTWGFMRSATPPGSTR